MHPLPLRATECQCPTRSILLAVVSVVLGQTSWSKAATHNSVDREGESNGANILLCLRVAQTASGMV